mmetsp:Transcript_25802/g.39541  ORF Transcript_25802/g.39541 Transcript_25802/m.39541 type:complete len:80 (+) Transcript_25802:60-299(+)
MQFIGCDGCTTKYRGSGSVALLYDNPYRRNRNTTTSTGTVIPSQSLRRDQIPPPPYRNEVRTFSAIGIETAFCYRNAGA